METKEKFNIYKDITLRILEKLRTGVIPWQRSFCTLRAMNWVSQSPYSILNQMLLGDNGEYITFRQADAIKGAHVREGTHGKRICFFTRVEKKRATAEELEEDEGKDKEYIPVLRYYTVFPVEAVDGISPRRSSREDGTVPEAEDVARKYMEAEGLTLRHRDASPSFDSRGDCVTLPEEAAFAHKGDYYAELFRCLVMATGTEGRLSRGVGLTELGPEARAREELTCEMGSAMLLALCGMDPAQYLDHSTAYIAKWISVLEDDWRAVVTAASRAQKAVDRILDLKPKDEAVPTAA